MFKFFTGNTQVVQSQIVRLQREVDTLKAGMQSQMPGERRLETRIEQLSEDITALQAALHRLRGQFFGPKAQEVERAPRNLDGNVLNTKDALRKRAGIVAGRPAPHNVEQPGDE